MLQQSGASPGRISDARLLQEATSERGKGKGGNLYALLIWEKCWWKETLADPEGQKLRACSFRLGVGWGPGGEVTGKGTVPPSLALTKVAVVGNLRSPRNCVVYFKTPHQFTFLRSHI